MVNVGLRGYLWEEKERELKLAREVWNLNGVTYHGYREFVKFVKDQGLSEIYTTMHQGASFSSYGRHDSRGAVSQGSVDLEDGTSEVSAPSTHSSMSLQPAVQRGSSASSYQTPPRGSNMYTSSSAAAMAGSDFATAKHLFDVDSVVDVTVVQFCRSNPRLLAMGLANGVIKVGSLDEEPPSIQREFKGHNKAVADLDWSPDGSLLLTAGRDGHVVAWNIQDGQAVRALSTKVEAPCCKFHPVNPNLFVVGAGTGEVKLVNCSTGITVESVDTRLSQGAPTGAAPVAMAVTPNLLCVGDADGYLHLWRAEIRDGQLQPLQLLCRNPPPRSVSGSLTSLQYAPYCKATGGPALVSGSTDGSVCIWDLDTWTGRPKLKGRGKLLQAEGRLRVALSPMVVPGDPQYMAVGSQDNAIEVYDISDATVLRRAPRLVARLTGHASTVTDVSWSSGAPLLASADTMGTAIIWEIRMPR